MIVGGGERQREKFGANPGLGTLGPAKRPPLRGRPPPHLLSSLSTHAYNTRIKYGSRSHENGQEGTFVARIKREERVCAFARVFSRVVFNHYSIFIFSPFFSFGAKNFARPEKGRRSVRAWYSMRAFRTQTRA